MTGITDMSGGHVTLTLVATSPWETTGRLDACPDVERDGPAESLPLPNVLLSGPGLDDGRDCSIRLSRETLRRIAPHWERLDGPDAVAGGKALNVLRTYLLSILADGDMSPSMAQLADRQIRELLALALAPASELVRPSVYGGVKAARLRAIQEDIAGHFSHPGLSAADVGRRLGISGRYVQHLLEGVGTSFSQYVRNVRLDHSRRLLRDPLAGHKRISDICEMAGFSDLSYFNHAFRARFGHTPKDERRNALA